MKTMLDWFISWIWEPVCEFASSPGRVLWWIGAVMAVAGSSLLYVALFTEAEGRWAAGAWLLCVGGFGAVGVGGWMHRNLVYRQEMARWRELDKLRSEGVRRMFEQD
jgi:hypothetical protein